MTRTPFWCHRTVLDSFMSGILRTTAQMVLMMKDPHVSNICDSSQRALLPLQLHCFFIAQLRMSNNVMAVILSSNIWRQTCLQCPLLAGEYVSK